VSCFVWSNEILHVKVEDDRNLILLILLCYLKALQLLMQARTAPVMRCPSQVFPFGRSGQLGGPIPFGTCGLSAVGVSVLPGDFVFSIAIPQLIATNLSLPLRVDSGDCLFTKFEAMKGYIYFVLDGEWPALALSSPLYVVAGR
jgi:hypothetical protein